MLRIIKRFWSLSLLVLCAHSALGFSLLGPNNEPWQDPTIGYNPAFDPLPTGPKNIGEEYRRNTPVLYYTFDANFLDYFGTNGVRAVEEAVAVFNALTNVSSYSRELTEFPLQVTRENYQASALQLLDVKSQVMKLLIEQLGLAEPERYIWTLHTRFDRGPAPCPVTMEYILVRRNWDPVPTAPDQLQASSYVNGTLYSYSIYEFCQPPNPIAEAIEFPVDPLDFTYTAVASGPGSVLTTFNHGLPIPGKFYTGLTRDDVGGLRYLLRAPNMNWESTGPNTLSLVTNPVPQLIVTSNLTLLAAQAQTNTAAALQALYPGLTVTSSSNVFKTVWVTNVVPYFTNSPFAPATNTVSTIAFATNRTLVIQSTFEHTFDNLFVTVFTNNMWTAVPITTLSALTNNALITFVNLTAAASQSPFAPAGSFVLSTNLTIQNFRTNTVVGEFFILPTNACEAVLIAPALTTVTTNVNILAVTTNVIAISNATTVTNITETFIQSVFDYSTTHVFSAFTVSCLGTNTVLAGGIERVRFERRDYDSLVGRFFTPFTNSYTLTTLTNSTVQPMRVLRIVNQPDILFTAVDSPLTVGPGADPSLSGVLARGINFGTNATGIFYPGIAGPGTIESPTTITLNKGGPLYFNQDPFAYRQETAEANQIVLLAWGSFDGTTNPPVVYPNGQTLQSIEDSLFIQVSPSTLTNAQVGHPYEAVTFTADRGTPPFTWSLAPSSPALPPGMTLSSAGVLQGTPTQRATYDFIIRMTDAAGRIVDRAYSLKVNW